MGEQVPLVFNPQAGGGLGGRLIDDARSRLRAQGIETNEVPTTEQDGARAVARRLAQEGNDTILALGGDGTLSETVDGVLAAKRRPRLGFLPARRGNDFLRDFGVFDVKEAVARIAAGESRPIDVARYSSPTATGHSINVFGTGYISHVGDLANRKYKWAGSRAYTLAVVRELVRLQARRLRLTLDDRVIEDEFNLIAVCNSRHTGGAMRIAPFAEPDDGLLDVVALRRVGRGKLLHLLTKVFKGRHVGDAHVLYERVKHVSIEPNRPSPLLVEGEILGTTPVELDVMPGAVDVLV